MARIPDDVMFEFLRNNYGLQAAVRTMNSWYDVRHTMLIQEAIHEELQYIQRMMGQLHAIPEAIIQPIAQPAQEVSTPIEKSLPPPDVLYDPLILREVEHETVIVQEPFKEPAKPFKKYLCNFCPESSRKRFASTCGVRKHCRKDHAEKIKGTNGKVHLYSTPIYN